MKGARDEIKTSCSDRLLKAVAKEGGLEPASFVHTPWKQPAAVLERCCVGRGRAGSLVRQCGDKPQWQTLAGKPVLWSFVPPKANCNVHRNKLTAALGLQGQSYASPLPQWDVRFQVCCSLSQWSDGDFSCLPLRKREQSLEIENWLDTTRTAYQEGTAVHFQLSKGSIVAVPGLKTSHSCEPSSGQYASPAESCLCVGRALQWYPVMGAGTSPHQQEHFCMMEWQNQRLPWISVA